MSIKDLKIGIGFTGSFCTYQRMFKELQNVVEQGAVVTPVFSFQSQQIDSRFGKASDFLEKARTITGKQPITTISQAEPIGPKGLLDVMVISPCTGNTLAKLAGGMVDSPVLMAAKSHLRNNRPVVISVSTNDALGMNLKNIGLLMNTKNIYFVPFGQDDYAKKPNSMVAHMELLSQTIEEAVAGRQLQPVIQSPYPVDGQ